MVDDETRGHTPLTIELAAGAHQLDLARPRYAPVHLEARAPGRVVVPLERPTATLRVTSTPPGAEVRWRNHSLGRTPLELPTAAYETYALEIERDGHTRHRHVYLKPPQSEVTIDF
jgi:hypothetical protein